MANQTVYLSGMCEWAKVYKPDPKYKTYQLNLFLDDKSKELFKLSGMQSELRNKEDGKGDYITLRRKHSALVKDKVITFGPPEVLNADKEPITDLIGNGSEVTCKVSVYDTMKGKGARLEAVRVDELVEYKENEVIGEVADPF